MEGDIQNHSPNVMFRGTPCIWGKLRKRFPQLSTLNVDCEFICFETDSVIFIIKKTGFNKINKIIFRVFKFTKICNVKGTVDFLNTPLPNRTCLGNFFNLKVFRDRGVCLKMWTTWSLLYCSFDVAYFWNF